MHITSRVKTILVLSLIDGQSQKMTGAAKAMADRKTLGHLAQRIAIRRPSFSRLSMIELLPGNRTVTEATT